MNRRDAIYRVTGLMGVALSTPFLTALAKYEDLPDDYSKSKINTLSDKQKLLIAEISELIIPTTSTPGAKAAKVPEFIMTIVADCYPKDIQDKLFSSLDRLDDKAKTAYGTAFLECKPTDQTELLKKIESESRTSPEKGEELAFFPMIKELTLFGYFTSQIGCTQALNYNPVPGSFKGCVPLEPNQKAWALN